MNLISLIDQFQSRGGVIRKFSRGDSADYDAVISFLQRRGYRLTMERGLYKITGSKLGRPKRTNWVQVIRFVDRIRNAEGLPTILGVKA